MIVFKVLIAHTRILTRLTFTQFKKAYNATSKLNEYVSCDGFLEKH